MSGINMARTIKKIEPPRPLKSNMGSIQTRNSLLDIKITSVEDLVVLTESVAYQISQGSYDRCLQSNISSMYQHLKIFGAQLEMSAKDLLDRSFAIFRNGCQDDKLDKRSRTHLLELVELRAKHWQCDENMNLYYKKSGHIEALRTLPVDSLVLNDNLQLNTPAADTLPLLGPGEIIKTSGKFTKPTKIPGKNYSKDEVVIRNSDSGKVSPGAKERLVQITGSNEENVNHAKHLIGDTIRRNASPVRLTHIGSSIVTATSAGFRGSASSLNSSASDESPHPITVRDSAVSSHKTLLHSLSTNDAALRDYQHTVAVGDHSIKIKGTNPEIVRTAKLVLDEYFANIKGEFEQTVEGSGDFFTLSRSLPHQDLFSGMVSGSVSSQGAHALRSTLTEEYNGLGVNDDVFIDTKTASEDNTCNETTFRRARFSRTASEKKEGGDEEKIKYSYDSILEFSESPLSKKAPLCIENFPAELQRKIVRNTSHP